MTSFKTTVVHRAQFDIVLQGQEHERSLTNTPHQAQNTWQSLSNCDSKEGGRLFFSSLTSTNFLHPWREIMSSSTAPTSISALKPEQ